MIDKEVIEELSKADAIRAAREAIEVAGTEPVALPQDFRLHDLEPYMPIRRRARGMMETSVVADFAAYVTQHREEGACVFVNMDSLSATAILNLGTPTAPGHADNRAKFEAHQTAAYKALMGVAHGMPLKQTALAEFLEDWTYMITCIDDTKEVPEIIPPRRAVAAVRSITVEALRKRENVEQQLRTQQSTFESVQASSSETLPTRIRFVTEPYKGLLSRAFEARVSVTTTGDKPALVLRIVNAEQHLEEMAKELSDLIRGALPGMMVAIGDYSRAG